MPADRFEIAGYAQFHPLAPNDTRENRSKNRRVEIVVLRPPEVAPQPLRRRHRPAKLRGVEERPSPSWVDRYLRFLGLDREPPSRDALARLVRAQIQRVAFENVTAILRRATTGAGPVPPPDPEGLLEAWESGRGGGVCFDLAPTFRRLLDGLGYPVQPLLAQISFPGSHHATLVDVDDRRYLVDVGSGSPLWEPVPLGETVEVEHVGIHYRLRPDGDDGYARERLVDGRWEQNCRYDLRPASAAAARGRLPAPPAGR